MRWVIWTGVSLIAIVGLVGVIGYVLPVSHVAMRSAEFSKPPQEVFAVIADLPNYERWWPGSETKVAVVESTPPTRFVTRIVGETAFGGTWTMEVQPTSAGSRLTITERGEVYNVFFRTLSKFVFGHTATIDSCLSALAKKLSA